MIEQDDNLPGGELVRMREFAVALSSALSAALERMAADQGFVAVDLAEVWFAE